ncbi:hypothetical protein [Acinetobacter sp. TGL-Y2]|uniref:hypothetical protein n=1 Tax=Acinetobacter TaxID=469 RepID=UPI001906E674|nr:hypothetical protein [Acinetobacter sp. TGL-Y2]MBJ9371677.1 hypothetical protein [Acinetobacter sp. TGL-Y2]
MKKKTKINRLVRARHKDNIEKTMAVQLRYHFNKNPWVSDKIHQIEIYSVDGLVKYKVLNVAYEGRRIIFLYGSLTYTVDLRN